MTIWRGSTRTPESSSAAAPEPARHSWQPKKPHGQRDPDVPWETALRILERVRSDDARVTLVKDGDHRLSRPQDLLLLRETLASLLDQDGA